MRSKTPSKSVLFLAFAAATFSQQQSVAQVANTWVGTWAAAADALPIPSSGNQTAAATTYRNIVHTTIGGNTFRVKLTNELGLDSLAIGEVDIAFNGGGGAIVSGTSQPVTFGGQASVTIPAGTIAISDPIAMTVPAFSDLAISIYVPQQTVRSWTFHQIANASNYNAGEPGKRAVAERRIDDNFLVSLEGPGYTSAGRHRGGGAGRFDHRRTGIDAGFEP